MTIGRTRGATGLAALLLLVAFFVLPGSATAAEPYDDRCQNLVVNVDPPAASPRVESGRVKGLPFNVLLPSGYATTERRYPVLYLLHGATQNEDSWLDFSDIEEFTAGFTGDDAAIVVMPRGHWLGLEFEWRDGDQRWETLYIKRLIPYIDAHFRTLTERSHRAIAGLSAGGYTALHLAGRYPDLFVIAGGFSSAPDIAAYRSPVGDLVADPAGELLLDVCDRGGIADEGPVGDPLVDPAHYHAINPVDHAPNFHALTPYVAAGNGIPCDLRDVRNMDHPLNLIEPWIHDQSVRFIAALRRAHVKHTPDLYGCGIHESRYYQRDLHRFWPLMTKSFGRADPASFDYRRADPVFTVWDWTFRADPERALEFLDIRNASQDGVLLKGSGTETVTTTAYFAPGQTVELRSGAGKFLGTAVADADGRITFDVDLGPPHAHQQYALAARLAGQDRPGYFTTRRVRFSPQ